jgi:hypothetical protein
VPVSAIGHLAVAGGRSPTDCLDGEWSKPREIAHLRGLIGRVGIPSRLRAVIYDQGLEIHVIGYDTEDEVTTTVKSLRRVGPE